MGTQQTYLERLGALTGVEPSLLRKTLLAAPRPGQPLPPAPGAAPAGAPGTRRPTQRTQLAALQRAAAAQDPMQATEEGLLALLLACLPLPDDIVGELSALRLLAPGRQALLGRLLAVADDAAAAPRATGVLNVVAALALISDGEADPDTVALVQRVASLAAQTPSVPRERLASTCQVYLSRLRDLSARDQLRTQAEMLRGLEVQAGDAPLHRAMEGLATRHSADLQMLEQQASYRLHT